MEIKYNDLERIVRSLSIAYEAMCNADFEFDCDEERYEFYEQLEEVAETLRFAVNLIQKRGRK